MSWAVCAKTSHSFHFPNVSASQTIRKAQVGPASGLSSDSSQQVTSYRGEGDPTGHSSEPPDS